ncbi:MAG: nuclear transport factor 2 family protein, partial [Gemmatimonadota bacterium]|nr:nuclear transport factor 2 family protein [Gemmatimonadota bacterium]
MISTFRHRGSPAILLAAAACLLAFPTSALAQNDEAAVSAVLDALHQAASDADFDRYFGLYAEDFIFLGTDATERWDRPSF